MDQEELVARMTEYLDRVEDAVDTTATFAAEQAPLLVQEYLAWIFYSSLFYVGVWVTVAMVFVLLSYFSATKFEATCNDTTEKGMGIGLAVVCGVCVAGCLFLAGDYAMDALQVSIAPRMVVLEYVRELVN